MQLTNIARDIGEDARMGRLYLPAQWFNEAGLNAEAWLNDPRQTPEITAMCERLLAYADILYQRSDSGVALLPLKCRPGIRAARLIYCDIGREIARQSYETVEKRAIVCKKRKTWLLAAAFATTPLARSLHREEQLEWPALSETRYLFRDVDAQPFIGRSEWLVDFFHELDKRDKSFSYQAQAAGDNHTNFAQRSSA